MPSSLSVFAFLTPSPTQMLMVALVALLLYGGDLPKVARSLAKSFAEFRRGLADIQNEINQAIYSEPERRLEYHRNVDPHDTQHHNEQQHVAHHHDSHYHDSYRDADYRDDSYVPDNLEQAGIVMDQAKAEVAPIVEAITDQPNDASEKPST